MFEIVSSEDLDGTVPYTGGGGLTPGIPTPIKSNPYVIVGGAAVAAAVSAWLTDSGWDVGTYNAIVKQTDDTIKAWDKLGWATGCWKKYPQKRTEWLTFWKRWSQHYAQYGLQSVYVSDSAEKPVRNILLPALATWGAWLNKTCAAGIEEPPEPSNGGGTDWGAVFKWGAIGLGAVVVLNIITGIRGAFPRQ